jgi:hypothetical protein
MPELNKSSLPSQPQAMSAEALARRNMLLKSLGKGSAVVAVASAPMHTLASSPTLRTADGTRCSISGMQSGNNSRAPSASGTCLGKAPSYWSNFDNWTNMQKAQADSTFKALFQDAGSTKAASTLREIVCTDIGNLTFMQRGRSTPDHERHCEGVESPKG